MKRILLLSLLLLPIVALAQYPTFSNKQKLGVQTTGDGLIFRGNLEVPNYQPSNINNAYFYLDTVRNTLKFYKDGWIQIYPSPQFDTTTLNVYLKISDTTAMLLPYFRDSDTTSLNLINRFALKLNISDTATMLTPYMKKADTISLSNRINLKLNISDTTILSNRITTNANNIITINNKLATKLDTIYVKFKNVVTMIENKDTINIGSSLTDGYAINIIGDSVNVDTTLLDIRYPDRDSTNELQDITFATTSGIVTISGGKVINLDTLYNSVIDSVNLLIRDSIAAFTPLTEGYGINIIGDSINIDTSIIFTQSDTITLSNRINTKLDTIYVNYQTSIDTIVNKDTINITTLEAGAGINITNNVISLDATLLDSIVRVQNVYVKNGTGTVLNKGEAVYVTGANGTNIIVGRASNVAESSSSKTLGLTMTSIAIDGFGYVVKEGLLAGLNTSAADSAGVPIWLGVNGALIYGLANKPYAPNHLVYLGVVTRKNPNVGEVYVTVQNGFEIKELHDVQIINPVNKASLYYNSSESLWRDTTAALLVSDTATMLSKYVNTYSNQTGINGDKTFNNVVTIDSATVTGKLLVNTNISDAVKISSNTNSTNLELANNSGNSVFIKSTNRNMVLQTDTTALMYLNGETNRVGILTMTPEQALQVSGTIRVDSLVNSLTPDKLVGANNANDLTDIKIGNGLSFSNDTLKVADNIINSGDTATLLRQDFIPLTSNQVIWTQGNKKLLPYFTQVYRNGQLLKDVQYTISSDSIVTIKEGSYKLGDNITIIAIDNIVALAGSGGIITLQGDITGNGTNSITTTIGIGKVTNTMLAGSISDSKLNTITTAGKVSNTATTATSANTNSAIVTRDNSGNFSAGTITASLNGNANTVTTNANLTGDVISTGNATSITTGVIVNDDINTSAAIAVSKLAASTISGITLGNNLNTLTISSPLTGTSYNGSSAVTIGIQAATTSVAGSMSAADKSKLDGIASNAINRTDLSFVAGSGAYNNTTGVITIPTNNNQITNGAGYATLASPTFTGTVVLPSTTSIGTVTNTEIGYVDGVTSAIQTQLNNKLNLTGGTLSGSLSVLDSISIGSLSPYTGRFTRYLKTSNISPYRDLFIGSVGTIGTWAGRMHFQTSYNTEVPTTAMTINEFGNINMNGTLGVTGATTLSSNLTVNGISNFKDLGNHTFVNYIQNGDFDLTSTLDASAFGYGYPYYTPLFWKSAATSRYVSRWSATGGYNSSGVYQQYDFDSSTGGALYQDVVNWESLKGKTVTACGWFKRSSVINTDFHAEIQIDDGVTTKSVSSIGTTTTWQRACVTKTISATATRVRVIVGCDLSITSGGAGSDIDAISLVIGDGKHQFTPKPIFDSGNQRLAGSLTLGYDNEDNIAYNPTGTSTLKVASLSGTGTRMVVSNNTGVLSTQAIPTGTINGSGTVNYIPKFTTSTTLGDANLFTNGNRFVQNENTDQSFGWDKMTFTSSPFFGNNVKTGSTNESIQRVASTTLFNPSAIIFGFQRVNNSSGATSLGGINFMTTSGNPSGDINPIDSSRMFIEPRGNIGIGTMQPSYKFDIRGTLGVTGETTLSNTTSTTPNVLLGKNISTNVVANVTTVAQTGLMTRGVTTFTVSGATATFDVTHSLGVVPNTIIITSDAINGSTGVFYEIILKTDTLFRVQGFNVSNGSPAINKTLSVNWLAIK